MDHLDMAAALAKRAGITLKESRDTLEAANWDYLQALVELERAGRLGNAGERRTEGRMDGAKGGFQGAKAESGAAGWAAAAVNFLQGLIARGNRSYICVKRYGKPRFELTVTVAVLLAIVLHGFFFLAVAVAWFMGYRFEFISEQRDKADRAVMDEARRAAREVTDRHDVNSFGEGT